MTLEELERLINPAKITVFTVGGCGEFGMNLTGYAYQNHLIIVDCGSKIAPEWMLGVEQIIPDISLLAELFGGIAGYVITHGHEDHLGALPYLFNKWPAKIYGTSWTLALVKERFLKASLSISADFAYKNKKVSKTIKTVCLIFISHPSLFTKDRLLTEYSHHSMSGLIHFLMGLTII